MEYLLTSLKSAFIIIISGDREFLSIVGLSLKISSAATLLASMFGIPLGVLIGSYQFKGRKIIIVLVNTLLSLPTIVIGLIVYAFLRRMGPFGFMNILFTPYAMVIGQIILATPIITALTIAAIEGVDESVEKTALTLGATRLHSLWQKVAHAKDAVLLAALTGFGRLFAEVGISMMVGGNIRFYTRNITTAIALETQKGEFELGLALGFILLFVAFIIALVLSILTTRRRRGSWVCLN